MNERTVPEYVEAYRLVEGFIKNELGFPHLSALKKHLSTRVELTYSTIDKVFSEGRRPGNSEAFFREIATFLATHATKKNIKKSSEEYYSQITVPLREADTEKQNRLASYPDTPNHPGDGPNVSPPPTNNVEELVQFDILVSGDNWSKLGRFLLLDLYFGKSSIPVGDKIFDLHLTRCQLKLSLDSAITERADERTFEDEKNSSLRLKISVGAGTGRKRFWEIAHLKTGDPLAGTFVVHPLCKIEQEIRSGDSARLVATPANVMVTSDGAAEEKNPEKQRVIEQLMKLRRLSVLRDGTIQFSSQKLRR